MKKIIIIDGGPRRNFNTAAILQKVAEGAISVSDQIEVKTVRLYDFDYKGCMSCMACKIKGKASNVCRFKDALTPILEEIALQPYGSEADACGADGNNERHSRAEQQQRLRLDGTLHSGRPRPAGTLDCLQHLSGEGLQPLRVGWLLGGGQTPISRRTLGRRSAAGLRGRKEDGRGTNN